MEPCLAHKLAHLRPRFTNRDFRPLKAQNWYPHSPLLTREHEGLGTSYSRVPYLSPTKVPCQNALPECLHLYDTQLLGACLHASECGSRDRLGAVRGMPDVPIAPPQPPGPRTGARLSAWSARRLPTGGYGGVCCAFWVNNPCFGGRNEPISGLLTVSGAGLIYPE
jgi:hypothetical protein